MQKLRLSAVLIFLISFTGCAALQTSPKVNELETRMAELERQLEARDSQLQELEENIQNISEQINAYPSGDVPAPSVSTQSSIAIKSQSVSDSQNIIRVEIPPEQLQTALKAAGYYTGPIDGKAGAFTKKAVIEFQRAHDLNPDGIVGKKTWGELKAYLQ